MSDDRNQEEPGEIEALLPWYVAGTLSEAETHAVGAALRTDPQLALQRGRIEEERAEAIGAVETVVPPSSRMAERLFAEIAADLHQEAEAERSWLERLGSRLSATLGSLAPSRLGLAAVAGILAVFVIGGAVGSLLTRQVIPDIYQTASGPGIAVSQGAFALIAFDPAARADRIAIILSVNGASIVDGPRPGAIYRIRIGPSAMTETARRDAIAKLAADKATVKAVIASP